jgi:hypothetical protein
VLVDHSFSYVTGTVDYLILGKRQPEFQVDHPAQSNSNKEGSFYLCLLFFSFHFLPFFRTDKVMLLLRAFMKAWFGTDVMFKFEKLLLLVIVVNSGDISGREVTAHMRTGHLHLHHF